MSYKVAHEYERVKMAEPEHRKIVESWVIPKIETPVVPQKETPETPKVPPSKLPMAALAFTRFCGDFLT
jgi:hypothetical protein